MAYTLTCHSCGQKLPLFDSAVKKRKGTIRCTRCGRRIPYDLDARQIQGAGFWAAEESAFDTQSKKRLLSRMAHHGDSSTPEASETKHPFQAPPGFASFDRATGQIIDDAPTSMPKRTRTPKRQIHFSPVRRPSPTPSTRHITTPSSRWQRFLRTVKKILFSHQS